MGRGREHTDRPAGRPEDRPVGRPVDRSEAVDATLTAIGVELSAQVDDLVGRLTEAMAERIPELPHDPALVDLLQGSTGSNLETVAHLLRGRVPLADVRAPSAAVEYARRLAQRGTAPSALLRAYRLGQQLVLQWCTDLIAERVADAALALATVHELTDITFRYIDTVAEEVTGAYQVERDRWLANRSAVQRETVDALLRGDRIDLAAAESALGYRLRQHHLGAVLWVDGSDRDRDLTSAERLVSRISQRIGVAGAHPLFIPRDRAIAWAWIPIGRTAAVDLTESVAEVDRVLAAEGDGVHVALGTVGAAETGFGATHAEALSAQAVAEIGRRTSERAVCFAEAGVRAASLLVRDLDATRRLVDGTLGALAEDGEAAARLRETLLMLMEERESYVATAARMHLHKNTVKYRVDRALEARGKPLSEDRLDLELALIACAWLGPAVLRTPAD